MKYSGPRAFPDAEPAALRGALDRLAAELVRLADEITATGARRFFELPVMRESGTLEVNAIVPVAGAAGSTLTFALPPAREHIGREILVQRLTTAGTIRVVSMAGDTITGSAAITLPASVTVFRFTATSRGWW